MPLTQPRRKRLRTVVSLVSGGYALLLGIYLVVRFVLGDRVWWLAFFHNYLPFYFLPLPILLIAALLARARRGLLLTMLLLVVGVLKFAPFYLPKPTVSVSGTPLKVISFNMWGSNPPQEDIVDWLLTQDADVVLLQEITPDWVDNQVPELLDSYPYQFSQTTDIRRWGLGVLSRHEPLTFAYIDLENDGSGTHQRLTFDYDGTTIAVYNVHLHKPLGGTDHIRLPIKQAFVDQFTRYDSSGRDSQVRELLAVLIDEPHPFIVAGDFNLTEFAALYRPLAATMYDSYRIGGSGFGATWPVAKRAGLPSWLPPMVRIDYIWHSAAFKTVTSERGPRLGSDHLPLIATLDLRGE